MITTAVVVGLAVISLFNMVMFTKSVQSRRPTEDQVLMVLEDPSRERQFRTERRFEVAGSVVGTLLTQFSVIGAIVLIVTGS